MRQVREDFGAWTNSEDTGASQGVGWVFWPRGPRNRGWLHILSETGGPGQGVCRTLSEGPRGYYVQNGLWGGQQESQGCR